MSYIYVGKIVNTHGIKGEVKVISDFTRKDIVFSPNYSIYVGDNKEKLNIKTHRTHKNFDLLSFGNLENINLILKYKGSKIYIKREELNIAPSEYILEDLIGMQIIYNNESFGQVKDIYDNKVGKLLYIEFTKNYYIPYNDYYIKEILVNENQIHTNNIKDLII